MAGAAVHKRSRHALKLWHRWFGLLAGLWLALLAITGCAITFYSELDGWLNPDWRSVAVRTDTNNVSLDVALDKAGAALPGFKANMAELPSHEGATLWMMGNANVHGTPIRVQIFSNPYDGTVLGWRETGKIKLDRRHIMDVLYGLHLDLLAGPWMMWFFGLVSLLWLIDHVIAVILAFPKGARLWKSFRLSGSKGSLRRLYDLHRAPGLWLAPVTFVLALTGITLTWHDESRHVVESVLPLSHRLHEGMPELKSELTDPVSIDAAILKVTRANENKAHSVRFFPHQGLYAVRTFHPRDLDDQGRLWTYVNMVDGSIIGQRHDNGNGAGDTFFAWQYPLHSGKAFGFVGRLLIFVGGIATVFLCVSGFLLWKRRKPS